MRIIFVFELILLFQSSFGQRYIVKNGDTVIAIPQIHKIEGSDTFYVRPCNSFEFQNGKIINVQDNNCKKQGYWVQKKNGRFECGLYDNNIKFGKWVCFKDSLLTDTCLIQIYENGIEVEKILFNDGNVEIVKVSFLEQIIPRFWGLILIKILLLIYIRVAINNQIFNSINETNISLLFSPLKSKSIVQLYKSMFNLYWPKGMVVKYPSLKKKMKSSNVLSILLIIIFSTFTLLAYFTGSGID